MKDCYYTTDHEWINFQGSIAFIGVCNFKLLGFKEIHDIRFIGSAGFMKKGELIATITYKDYQIEARMPVDGNVLDINDLLIANSNTLLNNAESSAWLVRIAPSQPYERKDLLLPVQYQKNGKSKYAKQ
jgi:glycine cleavage system H protein